MSKKGGVRMTMADVNKLIAKGAKVVFMDGKGITTPARQVSDEEPRGKTYIKEVLERENLHFVTELKFHKKRKFRFDFAIPGMMLAIEYEGLMSAKSRHTTISGYTRDAVKYNLAQLDGWTVLRYTASNYDDFDKDLMQFLKK